MKITVETQCMWNVKTNMIPVIMGATGTISKSFRKYLTKNQGTKENSHTGLYTHTSEITNVKVQNIQHAK